LFIEFILCVVFKWNPLICYKTAGFRDPCNVNKLWVSKDFIAINLIFFFAFNFILDF